MSYTEGSVRSYFSDKKCKGERYGERKVMLQRSGDDSIAVFELIRNTNGKTLVKNGVGYFYGNILLISPPGSLEQPGGHYIPNEPNYNDSMNRFLGTHQEFYNGNPGVFSKLAALLNDDPSRNYIHLNRAAGNFLNGVQEGEWFGYYSNDETDSIIPREAKDTSHLVMYYREMERYNTFRKIKAYSYTNYSKGLREGNSVSIYNGWYRKGNYRNGKKEGEWDFTPCDSCRDLYQYYTESNAVKVYWKVNYKNDIPDGIATEYRAKDGKVLAQLFFREGRFIGPVEVSVPAEVPYFYYRAAVTGNNLTPGVFLTPLGDTLTPDQFRQHVSYFNSRSVKGSAEKHNYQWDYNGTITYEEKKDANGLGYTYRLNQNSKTWDIRNGKDFSFLETSLTGDTLTYHAYVNGKMSGLQVRRTSPDGIDYSLYDNGKEKDHWHKEKGVTTMKNGKGWTYESDGMQYYTYYWENGKPVKRIFKKGMEESIEIYRNGLPLMMSYMDSTGKKTVIAGNGYRVIKPHYPAEDSMYFFINGNYVSRMKYDMNSDPSLGTKLSFYAKRTVTEVKPGIYLVNYKVCIPYNMNRAAVMDTFPQGVSIIHIGTPYYREVYWSTSKKNNRRLELFIDNENGNQQNIDENVWIKTTPNMDPRKIKGSLFFGIEHKTKHVTVNSDLLLGNAMAQHDDPYDITNSFIHPGDDSVFIPNRCYMEKKAGDFEVRREIIQYSEKNHRYYFKVSIKPLGPMMGNDIIYYREGMNTSNINLELYSVPDNYGEGDLQKGKQLSFKLFDKKKSDKYKISLNSERTIEFYMTVNDDVLLRSHGTLIVNGKEFPIDDFATNEFDPEYKRLNDLDKKQYEDLLNSFNGDSLTMPLPHHEPTRTEPTSDEPVVVEKTAHHDKDNPRLLHVTVRILTYYPIGAFAVFKEELNFSGATITPLIQAGGQFSFSGDHIKFVWVNFPADKEAMVSYDITLPKDAIYSSTSSFKYVHNNQAVTVKTRNLR
jgi:hypothetical protein